MTVPEIPEQTTITLPKVCRAAMSSLLKAAPPDYTLQDLLDLVLAKGLCQVLHGREHPEIGELKEQSEAAVPVAGNGGARGTRAFTDFVGFSIDEAQQKALEDLEERFPLVDDEEMGRVLLDCALRALPTDDLAQQRLAASFTSWFAREAGKL